MDKNAPTVDPIVAPLGDLGKYQFVIWCLVCLSKFPSGWIQLAHIFFAVKMNEKCTSPANVTDACSADCEKFEYDRSVFKETPVTQWDLVCDTAYLMPLSQTITMGGIMCGSMLFGVLSDKFGRRPTFIGGCVILMFSSALLSAVPFFWLFCILRFISATATGGVMVTSFVIIMEIVGKSKREFVAILYQIPFNLGHATLPVFAYFFRNWRLYNLSFSLFHFVYLIYFFVIPESPRWLLAHGKVDKASDIIEKGAKINKKPTETIRDDLKAAYAKISASQPVKKGTLLDLFRTPYLRIKTCAMAFEWFVICLVYYGISQYITNLSGDIFINVAIGAWLGIPGTIICVPLTKYLGRKPTLIMSTALTGVAIILMAVIPNLTGPVQVALVTCALFGATVTFPNVYIYGGELFPTVVRNSGIGLCSFVGRMGSMIAPFIADLAKIKLELPGIIFGIMSLLATGACFLMPETKGITLPETLEDGENFGKKKPEEN